MPSINKFSQKQTLKHFEKVEPHCQQDVVGHEPECNRRVWEDVVQVGNQRPVAVVTHHVLWTVDNLKQLKHFIRENWNSFDIYYQVER